MPDGGVCPRRRRFPVRGARRRVRLCSGRLPELLPVPLVLLLQPGAVAVEAGELDPLLGGVLDAGPERRPLLAERLTLAVEDEPQPPPAVLSHDLNRYTYTA